MVAIPPLQRQVLKLIRDEASRKPVSEWLEEEIEFCLDCIQNFSHRIAELHRKVEQFLSCGVEARRFAFAREIGRVLGDLDEQLADIRPLAEQMERIPDPRFTNLVEALHLLSQGTQALRDFLADAVARASASPPAFDESRLPPAPTGPRAEGYLSVREAIDRVRAGNKG
jgi:hypothetical protein